jgi:hypothetical protein
MSRGFRISAAPYDGRDGYSILLNNRYPQGVVELSRRLDEWADSVAHGFGIENITTLELSEEHGKRVEAITGGLGLNRQNEHALTCATISHLIGIDITEELKHGIETIDISNEEFEDEIEETNNAILAVVGQQSPIEAAETVTIKQSTVKKFINEERDRNHRKPLGNTRFAAIYRAAGIKTSWIRGRHGRNYWVIPMRHLRVLKGLLNLPNLVNLPEKPDQQTLKVDKVDKVDTGEVSQVSLGGKGIDQATQVVLLHEDAYKGAPYDELVTKYGLELVERERIPKIGGLPEPVNGGTVQ